MDLVGTRRIRDFVRETCLFFPSPESPEEKARQAPMVEEHLTTVVVYWLAHTKRGKLESIVRDAVKFDSDIRDEEAFHLLDLAINPESRNDLYFFMGLYLFLADEVSRAPHGITFLEAARQVLEEFRNEGIDAAENPSFWLRRVFEKLNLYRFEHIQQLVADLRDKGTFEINGELQSQWEEKVGDDNVTHVSGAWIKLAQLVCNPNAVYAQTGDCISLARAHKYRYSGITLEDMHGITKELVQKAEEWLSQPGRVNVIGHEIKNGEDARVNRIVTNIVKKLAAAGAGNELLPISQETEDLLIEIYSQSPPEMLDIIEYQNVRMILTDHHNLEHISPQAGNSCISDDMLKTVKISVGNYDGRNRIGYYARIERSNIPEMLHVQIHETWHMLTRSEYVASSKELFGEYDSKTGSCTKPGKVQEVHNAALSLYTDLCKASVNQIYARASRGAEAALVERYGSGKLEKFFEKLSTGTIVDLYNMIPWGTGLNLSAEARADLDKKLGELERGMPYSPSDLKVTKELSRELRKTAIQQFYHSFGSNEIGREISELFKESAMGYMFGMRADTVEGQCLADLLNINSPYYVGYKNLKEEEVAANVLGMSLNEFKPGSQHKVNLFYAQPGEDIPSLQPLRDFVVRQQEVYKSGSQRIKSESLQNGILLQAA